jgi:hypothetical protein
MKIAINYRESRQKPWDCVRHISFYRVYGRGQLRPFAEITAPPEVLDKLSKQTIEDLIDLRMRDQHGAD